MEQKYKKKYWNNFVRCVQKVTSLKLYFTMTEMNMEENINFLYVKKVFFFSLEVIHQKKAVECIGWNMVVITKAIKQMSLIIQTNLWMLIALFKVLAGTQLLHTLN